MRDKMSSVSAVSPNNDDGDNDGHFPGDEHEYVQKMLRKLDHVSTRQWTYLGIARRARLVKPPKGKAQVTITSSLTDLEFRALTTLVMYGSKDLSNSYPGLPKLAKSENWSVRVLAEAVQHLVDKGWVTRDECSILGTAVNQFRVPAGVLASWAGEWNGPGQMRVAKRR
jgi:hypothetical protein